MLPLIFSILALTSDAWLEDFRQLQQEMSTHYANLDSAIDDRKMDLPDLRRRTEKALKNAKNDDEARQALENFMRAFGDGHVGISWTSNAPSAPEAKAATLCERLRYRAREDRSGIDFSQLPEFTPITDRASVSVPGGILKLSRDRRAGILRISLFSTDIHPELCTEVQKTLALADDAACDNDCEDKIRIAVSDLLTAALERRVESLRAAGASAIVVDLTGNGGGTDWVEAAARVLTPVPLKSPRLAFVRHPHWVKILTQELADVEHDLEAGLQPRETLLQSRETLRRAIVAAKESCDRSGVWLDQPKRPDCSFVAKDFLYAAGLMPYAKRDSVPSGESNTVIFRPSEFAYTEGLNRLPLFVLIDGRTASASELFTAMLKDNNAATLIGTHTLGTGCGHINGGIWATLKNSGGRVQLPDCARFRADGTNEVVGIPADIYVPWRGLDSPYQRAAKTLQAIERAVK